MGRSLPIRLLWGLVVVLVTALASPVFAQDLSAARKHARAGKKAIEAKKYQEAIDEFQAAEAIIHAPPHLLFIARAQHKLGDLATAHATYTKLVGEDLGPKAPPPFTRAQKEGRKDLETLEPLIGRITIEIAGSDAATVTVNGEEAALGTRVVNPGSYEVAAAAEGFEPASETVEVKAGATVTTSLTLVPIAKKAPPPPPPVVQDDDGIDLLALAPWGVIGLGAAGLLVGAISGGVAATTVSDIREQCPNSPAEACPASVQGDLDSATTLATVSTVGFIVGGVLAAGGVTWLVINMTTTEEEAAGTLVFRGRF